MKCAGQSHSEESIIKNNFLSRETFDTVNFIHWMQCSVNLFHRKFLVNKNNRCRKSCSLEKVIIMNDLSDSCKSVYNRLFRKSRSSYSLLLSITCQRMTMPLYDAPGDIFDCLPVPPSPRPYQTLQCSLRALGEIAKACSSCAS